MTKREYARHLYIMDTLELIEELNEIIEPYQSENDKIQGLVNTYEMLKARNTKPIAIDTIKILNTYNNDDEVITLCDKILDNITIML